MSGAGPLRVLAVDRLGIELVVPNRLRIVLLAAIEDLVALAVARLQQVGAVAAVERIAAGAADQDVSGVVDRQAARVDHVVSSAAPQPFSRLASGQRIGAVPTDDEDI